MKKAILIVLVVGMLGWAVYDFTSSTKEDNQTVELYGEKGTMITSPSNDSDDEDNNSQSSDVGLGVGEVAPDFELQTLDGETMQLSDFRGKRVMINFWATWCPPCRAEMPDMQDFYDENNVVVLAVNLTSTEKNIKDVSQFVHEDFELTFPVLLDDQGDVSNAYQVSAYPTSYMIDSNGRTQFIAQGAMNYDLMVQELEKMN